MAAKPARKTKERRYKGESVPSRELNANEQVIGIFQGVKTITITDKKSGQEKEVQRYSFRDDNGKKFVILGRTMLDEAFADMFQAEGGSEKVEGMRMRIERGDDTKLPGKRTMGTYELVLLEE